MTEKSKNPPEFLYRYRPALDEHNQLHVERLFVHNEIYFAKPFEFNDPFDCRGYKLTAEGLKKHKIVNHMLKDSKRYFQSLNRDERRMEIEKLYDEKVAPDPVKFFEEVREWFENIMMNVGVFCLSATKYNILMWSHYSSSHRGFCLEFLATSNTKIFGEAKQVNYQSKFPKTLITASSEERVGKMMLTKSELWAYEEEWRILGPKYKPGIKNFPPELLKGVIFGCEMDDKDKDMIKEWIKFGRCKPIFYQAIKKKDEFGLEIVQI